MKNTKMYGYLFENHDIQSKAEAEEFRSILTGSLQADSYLDLYGSIDKCLLGSIDKQSYQRALSNGLTVSKGFKVEPIEMYFFSDVGDISSSFYQEFSQKERQYKNNRIELQPMMYSVKGLLNQEY
ncbi:hypothetical protein K6L05_03630 [Salinicoccus roseus]|uniref:hypothetical protein n=1 Tax=Salinicoccus roseus TaxID=45670 RepID=UPI001CA677F2|nr:hypothetical protein [Salinicoccus roseus]MBY8908875.1 hypothetical protein [Salinicoccus roseus]